MISVFTALSTVLFEIEFIRGVDLVFFLDIVLGFADGAN
jgi:hypothetical protein